MKLPFPPLPKKLLLMLGAALVFILGSTLLVCRIFRSKPTQTLPTPAQLVRKGELEPVKSYLSHRFGEPSSRLDGELRSALRAIYQNKSESLYPLLEGILYNACFDRLPWHPTETRRLRMALAEMMAEYKIPFRDKELLVELLVTSKGSPDIHRKLVRLAGFFSLEDWLSFLQPKSAAEIERLSEILLRIFRTNKTMRDIFEGAKALAPEEQRQAALKEELKNLEQELETQRKGPGLQAIKLMCHVVKDQGPDRYAVKVLVDVPGLFQASREKPQEAMLLTRPQQGRLNGRVGWIPTEFAADQSRLEPEDDPLFVFREITQDEYKLRIDPTRRKSRLDQLQTQINAMSQELAKMQEDLKPKRDALDSLFVLAAQPTQEAPKNETDLQSAEKNSH